MKARRPRSRALVEAIDGLNPEQQACRLDPPYTIGSALIWPVPSKDYHTVNRVRGRNILIADRMDLTLECIQLHYAGKVGHPLERATTAYEDFFELFGTFEGFVGFFHFQDLIKPGSDNQEIEYFLKPNHFKRAGTPATTAEYIEYRENRTAFIECSPSGSFIRGEGTTPTEADDDCWARLQRYLGCTDHEWEALGYTNGGGFCKNCRQFGSKVFTPDQLGLFCTTCQTPTFHTVSGSRDGELRCKEHNALWIYVLASIKATFHFPAPGQEKLTESMYQRLRAVRDGGPLDPEGLAWAKANLDLSDA